MTTPTCTNPECTFRATTAGPYARRHLAKHKNVCDRRSRDERRYRNLYDRWPKMRRAGR